MREINLKRPSEDDPDPTRPTKRKTLQNEGDENHLAVVPVRIPVRVTGRSRSNRRNIRAVKKSFHNRRGELIEGVNQAISRTEGDAISGNNGNPPDSS